MQRPGNNPAHTFADELDTGNALLLLLKQEQECLINADVDALTGIAQEKAQAVARMNEFAHRRHLALGAAGFEASETGMQAWLKTSAATDSGKTWNDLLELARQAKELNRTNGMLIGQHMARAQKALTVLQGNPKDDSMYGPNGQSASQTSSRKLVVG